MLLKSLFDFDTNLFLEGKYLFLDYLIEFTHIFQDMMGYQ